MSRQRVNRILGACLKYGIVEISINNLDTLHLELESSLKQKYGLLDIRIVDNGLPGDIYRDLGVAAGQYLASTLKDGDIIGFSRGRTLAAMAAHMPVINNKKLTAVQLLGSRNKDPQNTAANEIVHNFSQKLGSQQIMMLAPIFVSTAQLKKSLWQDPSFIEAYKQIKSCNISVSGIGTEESIKYFSSLTDRADTDIVGPKEERQIAGEVVTHVFDSHGVLIPNRYRDRIIAIELSDYFQIPVRIGVAGLPRKAEAIHAALKGKFVNVLVVDTNTARLLETM